MDESTPSPWAPPSVEPPAPPFDADAVPGAEPGGVSEPVSVVVEEPRKKKRTSLLVVSALVVLAGLGVGAFFVLKGDDTPTFALERAAKAAATTKWSDMKITMENAGQSIDINGKLDTEKGLASLSMNLNALTGSDTPIEAIIDTKNDTMYMGADFMKALGAPIDTKWVKIDRASLEKAGQDASAFDQLDVGNQLAAAQLFTDATKVKKIGLETIDGEQLQHDEVTIDTAELVKLNPFIERSMQQAGGKLPATITYQVYVTKKNEIRRLEYTLTASGDTLKVTTVNHILTAPPGVEVPVESDVTDFASLLEN